VRALRWFSLVVALAAAVGWEVAPAPAAIPSATTVTSIPPVGPLFFPSLLGLGPALGLPHYCSASVVHSTSGDLVLTAAHCVYGTGLGTEFAPGFHDGVAPYGTWTVTAAYVDPAWNAGDPSRDVAILRVARLGGHRLEDVVPGYPLGSAPAAGRPVTVDGYVAGSGGRPITCTAPVYYTAGYPSFDCAGFADGVSGGPWLAGGRLVGATGGLHQGGCTADTSYSAPFGAATRALLDRAVAGGSGDLVAPALPDC
jgi:V8-like Glu-specific endopeptidase